MRIEEDKKTNKITIFFGIHKREKELKKFIKGHLNKLSDAQHNLFQREWELEESVLKKKFEIEEKIKEL